MKDIPGTVTERFNLLLTSYFELGEIFRSENEKNLQIEEKKSNKDMIGLEYKVAILITDPEELKIAMDHYNFLRKYNLA